MPSRLKMIISLKIFVIEMLDECKKIVVEKQMVKLNDGGMIEEKVYIFSVWDFHIFELIFFLHINDFLMV